MPFSLRTGSDSPVMDAWFTIASPDSTTPSSGITLPTWMETRSPSLISEIGTRTSASPVFCHTFSIFKDMLPARSLTDFLWVQSSRSSPIPRRNMTDPAVLKSLLNMETVIAVASRTSTSSFLPASFLTPLTIYGTDWIAVHTARTGAGRKIFVKHLVRHLVTSFSWNS